MEPTITESEFKKLNRLYERHLLADILSCSEEIVEDALNLYIGYIKELEWKYGGRFVIPSRFYPT